MAGIYEFLDWDKQRNVTEVLIMNEFVRTNDTNTKFLNERVPTDETNEAKSNQQITHTAIAERNDLLLPGCRRVALLNNVTMGIFPVLPHLLRTEGHKEALLDVTIECQTEMPPDVVRAHQTEDIA